MTEYQWGDLRAACIKAFGQNPSASIEQRITDVFQTAPAYVNATIKDVIAGHKAGRIHTPWPFLAKAVENPATGLDLTATDHTERDKAVKNAENWMRRTGIHYDRPDEIDDELFGHTGKLRHWRDDHQLRNQLLELWQQQRPRGEQTEQEHEQYMAKIKDQRHLLTPPKPETT